MFVECLVSLSAARRAGSTALLAFGSDSFVELLSAGIVLSQFVPFVGLNQRLATRLAGILLFSLTGVVATASLVALNRTPRVLVSPAGMAITIAALIVMPVLAAFKRRTARELNNRALAADAIQSATCAYLAAGTLLSLAMNAWWHITWIDSVAALLAVPILVNEGRRAWRGEACGCC